MNRKLMTKLLSGFLLLFCSAFTLFFLQRPHLNWDMIGYVASARAYESSDYGLLQKEVYELLSRSVPEDTYLKLTSGYFRQIRATDPESLRQHLPFYQIRVVYVGLILALWKLGLNPFFASHFISAVCAALAIWILAFMLPEKPHPAYLIVVPAIALLTGFSDLAKFSTPDAMCVLAVFICYWLTFRRHKLLLIALPACILVRTDLLLLIPFFYIYLWLIRPFDRRIVAGSALLGLALYISVNSYFGNYGWSTVFHYTFIQKSSHPANFPHTVTMASYLTTLASGLPSLFVRRFLTYTAMTLFGIVALCRPHDWTKCIALPLSRDMCFAFISSIGYVVLHFISFPVAWSRFFSGQYALGAALSMYLLLEVTRSNKPDQSTVDSRDRSAVDPHKQGNQTRRNIQNN
ncbi:MAG: hypothetical protein WAU91_13150 [Desulfatitalea sp.]